LGEQAGSIEGGLKLKLLKYKIVIQTIQRTAAEQAI
jgi:hypothetical protein